MRRLRILPIVLLLVGLTASPRADAAGFYVADIGAKGIARGGAFVAAPDSVAAIHYNPAGLSLLDGFHFEVSATLVVYNASFERKCPCVDPSLNANAAEQDAALEATFEGNRAETSTPLTTAFIGFAYGFEPMNLTVGIAVYAPTSGRHDYGLIGAVGPAQFESVARSRVTRYNALEAPNLEVNYALAAAFEPLDGLRIGAGIYFYQSGAGQTLHLFADTSFTPGPEDPNWDVPIVLDFLSDPSFNWGVGVTYEPAFIPGLSLGASYRHERNVNAKGTIDVDLRGTLRELATVEGQDVIVRLNTAPIARVGAQYRLPEVFAAEAAFVWEGWGVNDRIVIEPQNIAFELQGLDPIVLGEIVSERNWVDSWSLRVGGELELLEPFLGVQAGYFFEPSAIPPEWLDPSRIDLDKHGVGLGLSTSLYGFTLDVSGMYVAMSGVEVTNSNAQNTAPIGFAPELRTTVGNGIYQAEYLLLSASLTVVLDEILSIL